MGKKNEVLSISDLGSGNKKIPGPFTSESLEMLAKNASQSLGLELGSLNF